jgi:hypothetical protein
MHDLQNVVHRLKTASHCVSLYMPVHALYIIWSDKWQYKTGGDIFEGSYLHYSQHEYYKIIAAFKLKF